MTPTVIVDRKALDAAVSEVGQSLAPDVTRIRYEVAEDWSGDPAIFFRVVLSDSASRRDYLGQIASMVASRLAERLDFDSMGLRAYHNFRSVSEQAGIREEAWE